MTPLQFAELLPHACAGETSFLPKKWTPENPTLGHCAVAAVLAQRIFGGKILRISLNRTPFAFLRSHYWNVLPDRSHKDFTSAQFGRHCIPPQRYPSEHTPEELLSDDGFAKRFEKFEKAFCAAMIRHLKLPAVIIESPYKNPEKRMIERNIAYARACQRHLILHHGYSALASHLIWTQEGVLDDNDPFERALGIAGMFAWALTAVGVVVAVDFGISDGMEAGIARHRAEGRPILFPEFRLDHELLDPILRKYS